MKYITTIDGKEFLVEIIDDRHVSIDGKIVEVDFESVQSQPVFSLIVDGESYEAYVYDGEEDLEVLVKGRLYHSRVEDERERRLRAASGGGVVDSGTFHLKAPMPGLVVSVVVEEGQEVKEKQPMVIVEAMKMENQVNALAAGKVKKINFGDGDQVDTETPIIELEISEDK